MNRARQRLRKIDLLARLLDEDAGGVDTRAGIALGFNNDRAQASYGGDAGAKEARETRAHNDDIDVCQAVAHAAATGVTLIEVTWWRRLRRTSKRKPWKV